MRSDDNTCSWAESDKSRARSERWLRLTFAGECLAGEVKPSSGRWQSLEVEDRTDRGTASVGGCLGPTTPKSIDPRIILARRRAAQSLMVGRSPLTGIARITLGAPQLAGPGEIGRPGRRCRPGRR